MKGIDEKEALALLECQGKDVYALFARANAVRLETRGYRVELDEIEAVLDREDESHLYPQKEALPYEESEPHLEIGGLRVEAVEALEEMNVAGEVHSRFRLHPF